MKLKFHIFLDRRQLLLLFVTVLFGAGLAAAYADLPSDIGWCIAGTLLGLVFLAGALIHPCLYILTERGLWICYALGLIRSFIRWDTVRKLEIQYSIGTKRIPYFSDTFRIHGKAEGPRFFFMENEMVRTRRARRLLERYTGFPVEGYIVSDLRTRRKQRREKQETERRRQNRAERVERNRAAKKASRKQK